MKPFKLTFAIIAVLALFFALPACKKVVGHGPIVKETRDAKNFTGVELQTDANVKITEGNHFEVIVNGQKNILDLLQTDVVNNKLIIGFKPNTNYNGTTVTIDITMPAIGLLTISGSGDMSVINTTHSNDISLNITGSGNLQLSSLEAQNVNANISGSGDMRINGGTSTDLNLNIKGSGQSSMMDHQATNATVSIEGSGNAYIWAKDFLTATISGSGDIYYKGNPSVSKQITGSGDVHKQ